MANTVKPPATAWPDGTEVEFVTVGTFEPRITMQLVEELNRRKIAHRIGEADHFLAVLYAPGYCLGEAAEALAYVKKAHPRVRL